jgi:hypothetical protein
MQYTFGSGVMIGSALGGAIAVPRELAVLQEGSVEFSFSTKELIGQFQFPVAVARGAGKISGKAKFANFNAGAINDLFFSGTTATGEKRVAYREAGTPVANTLTVANSATFLTDQGVFNTVTSKFLTRVASAPATGQYSVAAGVYTFAAADSNPPCLFTYQYSFAAAGTVITLSNQLLGVQPTFSLVLSTRFTHADGVTRQLNLNLNSCMSSKFSFATKTEDFMVPDFDFQAFADQSGNICTFSLAE